jgi:Mrp family chromosome partitioning ATPase
MPDELEPREAQGMTLRDYARVLARRWWLIALVALVAAGSAFAFSYSQTRMYQADARLLYESSISVASPLTGATSDNPTTRQAELSAAVTVLVSPDMQQRGDELLAKELGGPPEAGYEVEGEVESSGGSSSYTDNVVLVMGRSSDAGVASAAANAYAAAFIEWRVEKERAAINDAVAALKDRMKGYRGAAKQSTEYVILAQRLQDLEIRKATITGNFRLVVPATVPESPYEPRPLRSAILGLAVGLFAGIGLAFLLEQFDTGIHGHHEVARILHRPVIGRLPHFGDGRGGVVQGAASRVVTLTDPDGNAAEAFRMLRSNLEFMSLDRKVASIMVTSSEQGEGKSVTSCNLAVSLALAGIRVILIEGDLRAPRVHEYLGLPNDRGITTVVTGKDEPLEALQRVHLSAVHEEAAARPETATAAGSAHAAAAPADAAASAAAATADATAPAAASVAALTADSDADAVAAPAAQPAAGGVPVETVVRAADDDVLRCPPEFYPPAGGSVAVPDATPGGNGSGDGEGAQMWVLTRGPRAPNPGEVVASKRFSEVIAEYTKAAELVIVDTPAFLVVGDAAAIARAVDGILFVVDPRAIKRPTLEAAAERLAHLPAPLLGAVVVGQSGGKRYSSYDYGYHASGYEHEGDRGGRGWTRAWGRRHT